MPYKDIKKRKEAGKRNYIKNKEQYFARARKKREENPFLYKVKNSISKMKGRYGITIRLDDYLSLIEKSNGVCAICGKKENKKLAIDHCHTTNKLRGLLCSKCNRGLGYFDDKIELLEKAIKYLKNNG
jgi:hypothetical protein